MLIFFAPPPPLQLEGHHCWQDGSPRVGASPLHCLPGSPKAAIPAPRSHPASGFPPPEGNSASGMQEPAGACGPHPIHTARRTWELGFKFLLCKERPDLTQEQGKKKKSLAPASSVTTMVDPVILQALWRGLKHLQFRNLGVQQRRKASWIWGGLEEKTAARGKFGVVARSQEVP